MPIDPTAAAVIEIIEQVFPRVDASESAQAARRQAKEMPRAADVDIDEVAAVEDRTIPRAGERDAGTLPIRVYTPIEPSAEPAPGVVYFHGGGWTICDLDSHDGGCRRLASALGAVVVSVDYRLAPEHKFPAAAEDAYDATAWVAAHASELGIDPDRLVVAGDSAGGNLAAAVALMARDRGTPVLAYQLLIYPVIDSTAGRNDYPSKTDNAVGYFLTTSGMNWYREQYVTTDADGDDPYCSPNVAASLVGLAPACVVTAEMDPLRDEGEHYAALLEAAGVPVTSYRADGMFHGFFNLDAVLEGSKAAQSVAFDATRAALGLAEPTS